MGKKYAPTLQWSFYKYKYLWDVGQGQWFKSPKGSFTHIYTNQAKVEILFVKNKKIKKMEYANKIKHSFCRIDY